MQSGADPPISMLLVRLLTLLRTIQQLPSYVPDSAVPLPSHHGILKNRCFEYLVHRNDDAESEDALSSASTPPPCHSPCVRSRPRMKFRSQPTRWLLCTFCSIVRGQPLALGCHHAKLAVTFRPGTAAPIMAERMITNSELYAEVVRSHTRVNECVSALRSLGF